MTIASATALLFIGFCETLTFEIVDVGLDRDAAFVGVLLAALGVGAIAAGAMLVTFVDHRPLLLIEAAVVAAAGAWLLTRAAQSVSASH